MGELNSRFISLTMALDRLDESLGSFKNNKISQNTLLYSQIRDSVIKRFEFCVDIFWKCLKDYLSKKHGISVASPKSSLKECLAQKLISSSEFIYLDKMIDDRNNTSHCYDELLSEKIAQKVFEYFKLMKSVEQRLNKSIS
jgi:nucleotidyltransferase substrate binding protein (TIGR01987 family)